MDLVIAAEKAGRWYPITVNGYRIVNRASEKLAQETVDKLKQLHKGGYIRISYSPTDLWYEVWLTKGGRVEAENSVLIEVYLTRRYSERFGRMIATALGVPCVTALPEFDWEARK